MNLIGRQLITVSLFSARGLPAAEVLAGIAMDLQPKWLEEFVETAGSALHAVNEIAPIGCHYACVEGLWEVSLFFSATEVVGGSRNGAADPCVFVLDVVRLLHIFDAVESASWQSFQIDDQDDLKSHFSIVGSYRSFQIWLRVLAEMPDGIEPGRFLDASQGVVHDVWE